MTGHAAAEQFLRGYRGKHRVLLLFGPLDYDETHHGPFARTRHRDLGQLCDVDVATWQPRGGVPFGEYAASLDAATRAKGGVDYADECRKRGLVSVMPRDPGVVRPPRDDWRVSLEEETGLRERFGIRDDEMCIVLLGKDGQERGRYAPPVWLDDLLTTVDGFKDSA